jgi:hypothetical protein
LHFSVFDKKFNTNAKLHCQQFKLEVNLKARLKHERLHPVNLDTGCNLALNLFVHPVVNLFLSDKESGPAEDAEDSEDGFEGPEFSLF